MLQTILARRPTDGDLPRAGARACLPRLLLRRCAARRRRAARDAGGRRPPPAPSRRARSCATPAPRRAERAAPRRRADTRGLDQEIQGLKKDVVDLNKDLFDPRGGAAVPGQHPGGGVPVDGRRRLLRPRLGAAEDRPEGSHQLPVHPARGRGAAQGRRAAPVPRQPQGRASTSWWRSSAARARTTAPTSAAPRCGSRRASARSTWS